MKSKKEIEEFYDNFVDYQKSMAVNERHLILSDMMIELGLNSDSNVLELGCGIGVFSSLIANKVKKGRVVSTDISPKSIDLAKKANVKYENLEFHVCDVIDTDFPDVKFEFITLFDVLEHVPIKQHGQLFQIITKHVDDETKLLINIPNPLFLEYLIKNEPSSTQIIDQPLPADWILKNAYENNLVLDFFITYDIWDEKDYQIILFSKKKEFKKIRVPQNQRNWIKAIRSKLRSH